MKGLRHRAIPLISSLIVVLPATTIPADSSQKEVQTLDPGAMVIESQSLEVDDMQKIVVFTGEVDARRDDLTLSCEKLLVYYNNLSVNRGSEDVQVRIDKMVATDKVRITLPEEELEAMAEKAVYYQNDEKVVLTGEPVVKRGNDLLKGPEITLYLKEERIVVEGSEDEKVRAIVHPEGEKGTSADGQ